MGGTSYDIGIVVEGGVKHYDFNPVIDRWLVSVPMVHLVTLGAGGGSIATYDRMYHTVKVGPQSAGSDPWPRLLRSRRPEGDGNGCRSGARLSRSEELRWRLHPAQSRGARSRAIEDALCDPLDLSVYVDAALLIREKVDDNMANGLFTELRARGYDPKEFTMLAYGGNGPLHACGIARNLGINKILAPPLKPRCSPPSAPATCISCISMKNRCSWCCMIQQYPEDFRRL